MNSIIAEEIYMHPCEVPTYIDMYPWDLDGYTYLCECLCFLSLLDIRAAFRRLSPWQWDLFIVEHCGL